MISADGGISVEEESLNEAYLFEAVCHKARIHALFALRDGPVGFADLKRKLKISSSGNLQHHIRKLGGLVHTDAAGDYELTDQGREALIAIDMIRNTESHMKARLRVIVVIGVLAYYIVQMNVPFILGAVTPMTPVLALLGTSPFGLIFYGLATIIPKMTTINHSESST